MSFFSACGSKPPESNSAGVTALSQVPAVRLNYRYEADVPVPTLPGVTIEERNAAVQADFDTNRTQEQLDRTITSPDKKRVLAVYRNVTDLTSEVRLDMYTPEGKLLRKVTADTMAVHFPDTIIWSPDSSSVAFVAMLRTLTPLAPSTTPATASSTTPLSAEPASPVEPTPQAAATPAAPTGVLTFRTEQIYICNADGAGIKSLTQNEGLIYFYYVWSPDSTMLAALATTEREWRYLTVLAEQKGEVMVPLGRPRVVEKNGRERRLDDNLTAVHPVWSPDSAKVAAAFETQIRIYDAGGVNPTQAAIPLKNQLLISSQAYDRQQQQIAANSTDPNAAPSASPAEPLTTLPDEKLLVSYNPIVELGWTSEDLLYAKTAYLKRMKLETENVTSFARWHRLVFSAQPLTPVANK
ncbi:MAG TPA: hypothetical protein PKA82_10610 [Pyrinomonadaceae bacterium]|nr:hypothetical protein [Pyrinomonadaceae bacterium]